MQIYALISATFLSVLGSSITMVAIPWFLLEFTGDIKSTAVVMAIKIIPIIILPIYGSKVVDKYSKRNICIVSDIFSCITVLMIPLLYEINMLNIFLLVVLICTSTVLEQVSSSTISAMVPDMLVNTSTEKERLNGIIGSIHNFGDLAGPIIGGLIVVTYGASIALGVDALTFALSAALFCFFIKVTPAERNDDGRKTTSNTNFSVGFRFIFSQYCICFVALLSVVVNLLILPLLVLILPFMAKTQFDNALNLGFLISAFGAGALLASFVFTLYGANVDKLKLILLCNTMLLVSFIFLSFATNLYMLMMILFFVGISVGFFGPLDDTLLQLYTPKSLRGRVFIAYTTLRYATIPISMVVFGFLLELLSFRIIFLIMALCLVAPLIWLLLNRKRFVSEAKRLTTMTTD